MMRLRRKPANIASLELALGADGDCTTVHNMGCGVFVIDQLDSDSRKSQRVVITLADIQSLIRWAAGSPDGNSGAA